MLLASCANKLMLGNGAAVGSWSCFRGGEGVNAEVCRCFGEVAAIAVAAAGFVFMGWKWSS